MRMSQTIIPYVATTTLLLLAAGCTPQKNTKQSTAHQSTLVPKQNMSRHIQLAGAINTRDLGGIVTKTGAKIKANRLIRSGELAGLTTKDKQKLTVGKQLNNIVDLRTSSEVAAKPDPALSNVHYNHYDVTKSLGTSASQADFFKNLDKVDGEVFMSDINQKLVTDPAARTNYKQFFNVLLNNKSGATLWHCTAGKDRAGFGTMLVLSALGVDQKSIMDDYLASNKYRRAENEKTIEQIKVATHNNPKAVKTITAMMAVRKPYLQAAYDTMNKEYGGVNGYLKHGLGLTKADLNQLKTMYLTKS